MRRKSRHRSAPPPPRREPESAPGFDPRLAPEAVETLVSMIMAGVLDGDLPLLYNTIADRLNAIESTQLALALSRLNVGDRVRIGHTVKPAYLHGHCATVTLRGPDTITIQLDHPVGRFYSGIRISPLAVEKIGA